MQHGRYLVSVTVIAMFTLGPRFVAAQSKSSPVQQKAKPAVTEDDAQLYRNPVFGFRYRIPYGWVDRSSAMREGDEAGQAQVLLATFERPPEVVGDTVNSAVVIASESVGSYPGLRRAEDYLGPLTELATARGFHAEGEPYTLQIDSRQLVRADFVKPLDGKTTDSNKTDSNKPDTVEMHNKKLTMRQCTLVILSKGQILSFTFIASNEDDLDNLIGRLHFGSAKSPTH